MKNIQKIELTNKNKEFGSFKYNQRISNLIKCSGIRTGVQDDSQKG